jgi:DNA-binding response OmpR family regulator
MLGHNISKVGKPAGAALQCQTDSPRRILVVDDEPDIRRINAETLTNSGYEVDTAEDGQVGWKAVSHAPESYALLITDHNMPGLTGLALVKKLRDARITLPVVMATAALPSEDLFIRYPWLQPAAVLLKPYSVEQLLGMVKQFLHAPDGARSPISERGCQ